MSVLIVCGAIYAAWLAFVALAAYGNHKQAMEAEDRFHPHGHLPSDLDYREMR